MYLNILVFCSILYTVPYYTTKCLGNGQQPLNNNDLAKNFEVICFKNTIFGVVDLLRDFNRNNENQGIVFFANVFHNIPVLEVTMKEQMMFNSFIQQATLK